VADVGTGSGCLAVALAWELQHAEVFATDISAAALEVAGRNAARHRVADRIHFLRANVLDASGDESKTGLGKLQSFELIVSNPPYVGRDDASQLQREVREHEPHAALFGGPTGVEMYARLIEEAGRLLGPGGILVLELGYNSAEHVRALLAEQECWTNVVFTNDLAGIPRVAAADRI
jgi:release factor glutamine methyltransferase